MHAAHTIQHQDRRANAQADQAADFAAEQMAQRAQWSRLEWWATSEGMTVVAVEPAGGGINKLTTFATLWHRATAH